MSKKRSAPGELHARSLPKDEERRKRAAEGEVVETVAGAMAGEVIAAIAGKARKAKD
jgi:hypothetical protein